MKATEKRVLKAVQAVAASSGGVAALPDVRAALPAILRADAEQALRELEAAYIIDLKIANNPRNLRDGGAGGMRSDRGLIYYAIPR